MVNQPKFDKSLTYDSPTAFREVEDSRFDEYVKMNDKLRFSTHDPDVLRVLLI
jgi:hypothetical protein